MSYVFCFLVLLLVILGVLFYFLGKNLLKTLTTFVLWQNTISLEKIVREIIRKACIISIIDFKNSKLPDEEKTAGIVEKAMAISADVMLQHYIEPKNYNLQALCSVEIYRMGKISNRDVI